MSLERIDEIRADFKNALLRLRQALGEDVDKKGQIVVDGTIQRFEFTFELSWKLLRVILLSQGIEANTPKMAIKESFRAGILEDGQDWIDMLEDRNKTSHIYDEAGALEIYTKIKNRYLALLEKTAENIDKFMEKQL